MSPSEWAEEEWRNGYLDGEYKHDTQAIAAYGFYKGVEHAIKILNKKGEFWDQDLLAETALRRWLEKHK